MNKGKYSARITRKNPSAFIFMLDISGSMDDMVVFDGEAMTKAAAVALSVNNTVSELISRCRREEGYRDYFDLAVIGYGGDSSRSLLPEGATHKIFRKPSELAHAKTGINKIFRERRLPGGKSTVSAIETKAWIKPSAHGKTPMLSGFVQVYELLGEWIMKHRDGECFPPVVINITDGEATDGDDRDLRNMAEKIKSLSTSDGNVLMMNIFISPDSNSLAVTLPSSIEQLPNKPYARLLFDMSSELPDIYRSRWGENAEKGCRGMCYNASMADIVNMLNIGSVSVNLLE